MILYRSEYRYDCKSDVANTATEIASADRYNIGMYAEWLSEALNHSKMGQAELARRLTQELHRSIDRAAVNKMLRPANGAKGKPRAIAGDEMIAISELTGFPLPLDYKATAEIPLISWVSAGIATGQVTVELIENARKMIPDPGLPLGGEYIALEVEGDSMDRISPPGSIIFANLKETALVANACYVIADDEGNTAYKRFRPNPDRFAAVSTNSEHDKLTFPNLVRVIGRVRRSMIDM